MHKNQLARKLGASLCLLGIVLGAGVRAEGPFLITDRVGFNAAANQAADRIQQEINNGFMAPASRISFLESSAKAATSGTSTLLADRASRPGIFLVSAGGQAGYQGDLGSLGGAGTNALPPLGVGGQAGLLLGLPGSHFSGKLNNFTFFLHGGGASVSQKSVNFEMFNLGINAAYQLLPEVGHALAAKWGGIRLLSGLNYASSSIGYGGHLNQADTGISVDMNIDVRLHTSNFWIPLEVSSSLQLLYLFNIYAGAALDLNFGSAKFAGVSRGPVTTGAPGVTASAALDFDNDTTSAKTSLGVGRAFIGAQVSLYMMRLGAEYTVLSNSSKSIGAYLKLAL